jgi:hypothetical protein
MTTLIPKYDQGAANAVNRPINLKLGEFISVKDFGAVGDGTTNDAAAFTAALAAIVATNKKGVLYVPAGTYKINSSLSVNISFVSIYGESATLNFSSLTSGAALVVTATVSPPYDNAVTFISGLQLIGNSRTGAVKGIQYTASTDVSHFSVDNCVINTFGIGEAFETNSYLISHKNTDVWNCTIGVQNLTGFTNNGENISYVGCTIFNNGTNIVQTNGAGDMNFTNSSIDYPTTAHISITAGELHFVNCHIEGAAVPVFSNNVVNSVTSFTNCLFIQQTSSGSTPYITISGNVDFIGGRVIPNNSTSPAIQANSGASLSFLSDHAQYSGSQLFNLVSGCFYNIITDFPVLINGNYSTIHTSGNVVTDSNFYGTSINLNAGSAGVFAVYAQGAASQAAGYFQTNSGVGTGIAIDCLASNIYAAQFLYHTSSTVGSITVSSTTTAYNTSSDRRLKTNIEPVTTSGALIDALLPRTFTWKLTGETDLGFIADELQTVIPNAVTGEPNAVDAEGKPVYQQIDSAQPEMIALLVAEVQDLRKRVAALEAKGA